MAAKILFSSGKEK